MFGILNDRPGKVRLELLIITLLYAFMGFMCNTQLLANNGEYNLAKKMKRYDTLGNTEQLKLVEWNLTDRYKLEIVHRITDTKKSNTQYSNRLEGRIIDTYYNVYGAYEDINKLEYKDDLVINRFINDSNWQTIQREYYKRSTFRYYNALLYTVIFTGVLSIFVTLLLTIKKKPNKFVYRCFGLLTVLQVGLLILTTAVQI